MRDLRIPDETIRRLPSYLRKAISLSRMGVKHVSSLSLADDLAIKPSLIRRDFSYLGDVAAKRVGYDVHMLVQCIREVLDISLPRGACLLGAGKLGSALMKFGGFSLYNLEIVAAFDIDQRKIGRTIAGIEIEPVSALPGLKARGIDLGVMAVPDAAAQESVDALALAGVRGLLSFSTPSVVVPSGVTMRQIDIVMGLARLPYYLPAQRTTKT